MQSTTKWTKVPYTFYNYTIFLCQKGRNPVSDPEPDQWALDADTDPAKWCGSGSATMRDTAYEMKKLQKSLQSELERTFEGSYFLNEWRYKNNDAQLKIKCWGYFVANGRNFGCISQKGPRQDVVERTLSLPNVIRIFSNERKSAYFQADFGYILFSM